MGNHNVICFVRPDYRGDEPPHSLTCQVCCGRYIDRVKAQSKAQLHKACREGSKAFARSYLDEDWYGNDRRGENP